ncbi:MAG: aminotransferase class III-fold pyridoxal phosphate-dependent enzyme, partial [archaeon]|nr:aminotransferase class III-fold pyridoxal phosphate-dependent enzyme [archaeon]
QVCGFLVEPIQGEAGILVPRDGYLKGAAALCRKHNALLIVDEIQTGLGRTGKMLCHQWEGIRPDVVLLGKALSGGILPVSVVLADDSIMSTIKAGQHGSTYGGNPLGAAVAIAALDVLVEEGLCERAEVLGRRFRSEVASIAAPCVSAIRGKGLLNAVDIDHSKGRTAWQICEQLKENGLLAKPTHEKSIRFAPPLILSDAQMTESLEIIAKTFRGQ